MRQPVPDIRPVLFCLPTSSKATKLTSGAEFKIDCLRNIVLYVWALSPDLVIRFSECDSLIQ